MESDSLRSIPAVHRLTGDASISAFHDSLGREEVLACVRRVLEEARAESARIGSAPPIETLKRRVLDALSRRSTTGLIRVINGTGVILHTNLGRAPLSQRALDAIARLGAGYTNLEFDLIEGRRDDRYGRVDSLLREVSGAEATLVVNNCAAAVLLVLDTFARGREVVVSRGQLIEIGGSFRLPDVLEKSGARLVEVGTTNRTYGRDYRNAWNANTAMFMRTHPSNYRMEGFVAEVGPSALAALAKELGVMSFEDLGSGAIVDTGAYGLPHEPTLHEEISAGIDVVAVSGDKLLGGPQCGIIAGRRDLIEAMKRNPLLRALRVDKITLAALGATLALYLERDALEALPLVAMLSATVDELRTRAEAICSAVDDAVRSAGAAVSELAATPVATTSTTGGGTLPEQVIPSAGVACVARAMSADALASALRAAQPPIVARIDGPAAVIDLRTVLESQDAEVIAALSFIACGS